MNKQLQHSLSGCTGSCKTNGLWCLLLLPAEVYIHQLQAAHPPLLFCFVYLIFAFSTCLTKTPTRALAAAEAATATATAAATAAAAAAAATLQGLARRPSVFTTGGRQLFFCFFCLFSLLNIKQIMQLQQTNSRSGAMPCCCC